MQYLSFFHRVLCIRPTTYIFHHEPSRADVVTEISRPRSSEHGSSVATRWLAKPITEAKAFLESPIVRNAASLYGSTIVTLVLGFFYWLVAARMVSVRAVGIASAIQSAAALLSIVCVLGLSTLLISELARDSTNARSLMVTAAVAVGLVTLVLAVVVGISLESFSAAFREGVSGAVPLLIFALLSALTSVAVVLDDSCVGLLRGDLQLRRNAVFSVSKLLLLPLLVAIWRSKSGTEMLLAWLLGLAISLVTLAHELRRPTVGQSSRLNFKRFIEKRHLLVGHSWLNIAIWAPRMVLPVLVATIVGPQANAGFTIALLVVSVVAIIPGHLSTALFALTPGDETALRRETRKTMRFCLILSIVSAPFFVLFSHIILDVFGRDYETAAPSLAIFGLMIYPSAIKAHYVAIARVRGKMRHAAFLAMIGACPEVGLPAAGGAMYGETGVAIGLLIASVLEGVFFSSAVFGVLRGPRLHQRSDPSRRAVT